MRQSFQTAKRPGRRRFAGLPLNSLGRFVLVKWRWFLVTDLLPSRPSGMRLTLPLIMLTTALAAQQMPREARRKASCWTVGISDGSEPTSDTFYQPTRSLQLWSGPTPRGLMSRPLLLPESPSFALFGRCVAFRLFRTGRFIGFLQHLIEFLFLVVVQQPAHLGDGVFPDTADLLDLVFARHGRVADDRHGLRALIFKNCLHLRLLGS